MVEDAGLPTTSAVSVIAGMLVAFGAVGVVLAIAGAVGNQLGLRTNGISTHDWRNLGIAGAAVATVVLFGAFFLGGYTAGRMSRRAGASHGAAIFAVALVVIAVVVGLTAWDGATSSLRDHLSSNGVPTDAQTWSGIAIGATVAGMIAMLLGAVLGGLRGDRWHGHVESRAAEGREAEQRHRRLLGDDPTTTVDLTAAEREPSLEEERENARIARQDVGM